MFIYKHFVIFGTYPNNGIINMNKNQINWKVKINSKWVLYFPILLLQKEILFISAENTLKVVTLRTLLSPLSTTLFRPQSFLIRPDVEAFTHTYGAEMVFWAASVKQKKKKRFPTMCANWHHTCWLFIFIFLQSDSLSPANSLGSSPIILKIFHMPKYIYIYPVNICYGFVGTTMFWYFLKEPLRNATETRLPQSGVLSCR